MSSCPAYARAYRKLGIAGLAELKREGELNIDATLKMVIVDNPHL